MLKFIKYRSQIIEELVDNEVDSLLSCGDQILGEWLAHTLRTGTMGYQEYSNADLLEQYNGCFDPLIKVDAVLDDKPSKE